MSERPVALVTGGTRGIGKGISEALANQGFDLLLGYGTNEEAANQHATCLREQFGVRVVISGGDVAEENTISKYFEVLSQEFSNQTLQAVVHNAGQYLAITAENSADISDNQPRSLGSLLQGDGSVDLSHWRYYHRIYAEAWVQLLERALPLLPDGKGSIVGISSPGCNATLQPAMGYDMPGSAKCVMESTARYYAKALAPRRVTVNIVIPGVTKSDAWKNVAKSRGKGSGDDDSFCESMGQMICPMGYAQSARECGEVVAFLSGPHARYITGVSLPVDGGLHLGRPVDKGKGKGSDEEAKGKGKGYADSGDVNKETPKL